MITDDGRNNNYGLSGYSQHRKEQDKTLPIKFIKR